MYIHFKNPFLSVTSHSHKRMLMMARDHRDKLMQYASTDPDLAPLHQRTQASFTQYETALSKVQVMAGKYKSLTALMESLLEELRTVKARQWDIKIQNVYMDGVHEYVALMPQKRAPFQSGAYELRIGAVKALSEILKEYPDLDDVKKDVDAFYAKLNKTRTDQQRLEALDQENRQEVEKGREKLGTEMHRNMGYLIYKHYNQPELLSKYYELKYLQAPKEKPASSLKPFQLEGSSVLPLFGGELTESSYITIKNSSAYPLKVFASAYATATYEEGTVIEAGETYAFYANETNDGTGYNWLIVQNDSSQALTFHAGYEEVELE